LELGEVRGDRPGVEDWRQRARFELPDPHGATVALDGLVSGGSVILYFYPADFSPDYTAEARVPQPVRGRFGRRS
jgi:peroxiredoxin